MRNARKAIVAVAASLAVTAALPVAATAGNDGQKIGQDEIRLALTQCSNAGGGNGLEIESALLGRSLISDCLYKRLGSRYSRAEIEAIAAQSNCIGSRLAFVCEVDPGNSAAHNRAGL